jgi:hypothetical protein
MKCSHLKEKALECISLAAAITLTEWSQSTFRRRIADGSVKRIMENGGNGRSMVYLDSIKSHISIPLGPEETALLASADAGNAEAQNDLALLFLSNGKIKSALYWLELAIKQNHADAMHWLGRCYIEGKGIAKDENLGMMWLSKSAAQGHVIAQGQMQAMRDAFNSGKVKISSGCDGNNPD